MILVKELKNGLCLWKEPNKAGGHSYYSENGGIEHLIWDDCLGTEEEFLAILEDCYGLKLGFSWRKVETKFECVEEHDE